MNKRDSTIVRLRCIFRRWIASEVDCLALNHNAGNPFPTAKAHTLESSWVVAARAMVATILCLRAGAEIATSIIKRIVIAMISFFSFQEPQYLAVHFYGLTKLVRPGSVETARVRTPSRIPIPLAKPTEVSSIYNRVLALRQWDKAVRLIKRLGNRVSLHAFLGHLSTSNGLVLLSRNLIICALILCAPSFVYAQATTNVSGRIVATDGQSWNNGTYQVSFYPAPNNPAGQYVWNGQPFNPNQFYNGVLDATGSFTQGVPSNTSIAPGGSQWRFTVCPNATAPCYSTILTVTGATQDVTSSIIPPAISIDMRNPPPSIHTYLESELSGQITGQSYWNVSNNTLYYWDGTAWLPISGGGGGGCGTTFTIPSMLYSPTTSNCASTAFSYYPTGADPSTGACAAAGSLTSPTIYAQFLSYDSCWTGPFFATENFSGSVVSITSPVGFQTGTLSGTSILCSAGSAGSVIANQLALCNSFSGTPYPWSQQVSAANTYTLGQSGGTNITFKNDGSITVPGGCFIDFVGTPCGALTGLTTKGLLYATSATTATSIIPPATNNGQYNCGYTVTANTAVTPSCYQIGLSARAVTGTTDTVLYTDNNQVIEYQGSSAVATALPTPTTLQNSGFFTRLDNLTTGTNTAVTVTPATWTINGASTLVIPQNQSCRINVNPNTSNDWLSVCEPIQHFPLGCRDGLGDGVNAISAATYPIFSCVNKSGITWTITSINCFTDNAGSSTLDVKNNAGTSFLTGAVTCNNTKSGGGAAGTQSATVTLADGDAFNFTFVADGSSKSTTWTVGFRQ